MSVATVLAQAKSLVAGLTPSLTGACKKNYVFPTDITTANDGGLAFSSFPVSLLSQRWGNDAGQNSTAVVGTGHSIHNYDIEIMVALANAEIVNGLISTAANRGVSTGVVFAPYEKQAQQWLTAIHAALVADTTLAGTVQTIGNDAGLIIADYRIGYLPFDRPELWGLWCSVPIREKLT